MHINASTLEAVRKGFKAHFNRGLGQAASQYERIATVVPSTTGEETYGWLGQMPNMREWVGERHVHGITEHGYTIKNKDYELTIGVDKNAIKDDKIGVYAPMFEEMGRSTKAHPDQLVFGLLKNGFTSPCYDGQNFFDTDHPVLDENGNETTVSNTSGGGGAPWFLLDTSRALKPILFQEREKPNFVALDNPQDPNVFNNKKFIYGVDGRSNVGFGYWQMAHGSKQTLDAANYEAARISLTGMKGDHGRPLGIIPNLLVVGPSNEGAANRLMKNEQINGSDNEWKGTAEVLMVPWLA
ncbi:Mu-like prophage major head subunit gpT family protein [Phaeobacter sp. PT47_59]|uniref:Mu-like prophage major head subunit gpT family protein n=1 Tax=Phaeobacter sp. PT47_59 TaxID=3029979 RepID=UPI002380B898|nr:Mu-like prophage major head subunit gpT family protein [Phaeobacter sp. PT47_59]MDE4175796.1 Mu-like prophage major head subunit gpT family protein [Phaeobacter sp. PT47_59]